MNIRRAVVGDAAGLATLLSDYLREKYPSHRGSSADELERDVLGHGRGQRVVVAELGQGLGGFVAWDAVYDMHWAMHGAQIADLYVIPSARGRGIALALVAGLCAEAHKDGATFLRGASYDRASPTGRFYERIAVGADSAECHCSGRAFRTLAGLHGQRIRTIVQSLPPKEWNLEP
ncbi:MAG TPA: GNAT family N-acetyltransferase [Polyangiaceae bacterium]|nr:GNAT family N-acetyltransferase [Polyangiaceae bacterium]